MNYNVKYLTSVVHFVVSFHVGIKTRSMPLTSVRCLIVPMWRPPLYRHRLHIILTLSCPVPGSLWHIYIYMYTYITRLKAMPGHCHQLLNNSRVTGGLRRHDAHITSHNVRMNTNTKNNNKWIKIEYYIANTGLILVLHPSNERHR